MARKRSTVPPALVLLAAACAAGAPAPAARTLAGEPLERIVVSPDGRSFQTAGAERPFVPFGVNYFRPGTGWAPQVWKRFDPEATRRDFQRLRELGASCVRVFLTFGSFYSKPGDLDPEGLSRFDQFLAIAEEAGIYVHPTGPDHWEGLPEWARGDRYADEGALAALEGFWRLFAARYAGRAVVFAYDLLNEPSVPWDSPVLREKWNAWLEAEHATEARWREAWGEAASGLRFGAVPPPEPRDAPGSRPLLDYQRFRESIADAWTRRQAEAIRAADPQALVTVGLIQWSVPALLPGVRHYSAFRPSRQARWLDFLEVHFYPLDGGAYEYRSPEDEVRNLAYLEAVARECAVPGKPLVIAELGWYGGGKPTFDGGRHPEASEEAQAGWCRRAIETTRGIACGWLNWGFHDHPEARDVSQLTGLLKADGATKAWGREFRALAAALAGRRREPRDPAGRPALDRDACVASVEAGHAFRRRYLEAFTAPGKAAPAGAAASGGGPAAAGDLAPFVMPWDDASPGPADVSFLLEAPAGKRGFIEARDGRFWAGDRRIRFWGVNVCFAACFPPKEAAPRIAARLAKFGVNCVRFHHMDSAPFPRGVFKDSRLEELSEEALDRLDAFIAELASRGIYANLNLHVSRWLSRARGWPRASELPSYDKMVGLFHPELIEAQKRYAADLLTHRSSYTGRRYVEEPALAMVEITNEDSLFQWGSQGALARLPEPYADALRKLWNEWLQGRHGTNERLRAAWALGEEPLGSEALRDGEIEDLLGAAARGEPSAAWVLERHEGAAASLRAAEAPEGRRAVRVEVEKPTGVSWHVQLKRVGLSVRQGAFHTVRFLARADRERTIGVAVGQDKTPWANLGLAEQVRIGPTWKQHRFGFAAAAGEAEARLFFSLGDDGAAVELAAVSFRAGGRLGLREGESVEAGTVALFPEGGVATEARLEDRLSFLADTELAYFTGMRRHLKEDLGLKAPVTGTIAFGALGARVQAAMDFVDQHAYWQHPRFPRRPWDSRDWVVPNEAMSASREGGTLPGLAAARVLGKPYTVTEYNHPAPLDSQAETVPMIATFAAWQDWDGVFLFSYNHAGSFERDRIHGFFDIDSNPAKMAFLGAGALVFAGARLEPAPGRAGLRLGEAEALRAARRDPTHLLPHLREHGFSLAALLGARWAIEFAEPADPGAPPGAVAAGAGPIRWSHEAGSERYVVDAPAVKAVCGRMGAIELEGVSIQVTSPRAASLLLVSLDGAPLEKASRLLLVACGRAENTGMGWNAERSTVGDRWGEAPARVEVVRGRARIAGAPLARVAALDGRGQRLAEVPVERSGEASTFRLGSGPATVWYEAGRD
ncbi:MAG: cellulase family glycosylhydrolase [Planctomycetes bacterium]|nr:cellulase family glycosylhydrolase [Planctomycetota bacterium]